MWNRLTKNASSYNAVVHSGRVGPEGGRVLVDRTVELIDALWTKPNVP
jgi:hypothetical protein